MGYLFTQESFSQAVSELAFWGNMQGFAQEREIIFPREQGTGVRGQGSGVRE